MTRSLTTWSKRIAYILRHDPASVGLTLDPGGWVRIDDLLGGVDGLDADMLHEIVATDSKSRYTISGDRIRAAQGHTVAVDPVGETRVPPAVLFHGTTATAGESILLTGLRPGSRRDVHLSGDVHTARVVGARRGAPVILTVDADAAHESGIEFRVADNGVWLTAHVPAVFITDQHDQA